MSDRDSRLNSEHECHLCGHPWHGLPCKVCECPTAWLDPDRFWPS